MDGWQIILTFTLPAEAYMAKAYLESEGIRTQIQDELTAQVNNFYSNAIGGVKLWVQEADYEEGVRILKEGGYIVSEGREEEDWIWVKDKKDRTHCPFCDSDNIGKKQNLNIAAVILFFVLGVLFPLFRSTWKCYDCGKAWKYKKRL